VVKQKDIITLTDRQLRVCGHVPSDTLFRRLDSLNKDFTARETHGTTGHPARGELWCRSGAESNASK
jgi:hypothetical protein